MKLILYCLVAGLLGIFTWAAIAAWPWSRDVLMSPGFLNGERSWPLQIGILALAAIVTAIVFRPAIRRVEKRWHYVMVSTLMMLAGSVVAGVLLMLVPDLWTGASGVQDWTRAEVVEGIVASAIMALAVGVIFLPLGIPLGLGAVVVLRRVAGSVPSA
jgi:hypothetical protein